jgi:hypothetical protein
MKLRWPVFSSTMTDSRDADARRRAAALSGSPPCPDSALQPVPRAEDVGHEPEAQGEECQRRGDVSGFRWAFFGKGDVAVGVSIAATLAFLALCLGLVTYIFRTGLNRVTARQNGGSMSME